MATSRVFYGWWVTLAFAAMVFLSTGVRFIVGPFLKPMVADLHLDRASFSLVVSSSLFLYGVLQPFVGRVVDRVGARVLMVSGTLLLGASLASLGLVTRLWQLYVLYGVLVAVGLATTSHVVAAGVISRWFFRLGERICTQSSEGTNRSMIGRPVWHVGVLSAKPLCVGFGSKLAPRP